MKVEFSDRPKRDRDSNNVSIYHKTRYVSGATWNNDGKFIYYVESESGDIQYVKVFDAELETVVDSLRFIDQAGILDYNNTLNLLAVGFESVKVIDPITKSIVDLINFPTGVNFFNPRIQEMKWSPDGKYLAISFRAGNITMSESFLVVYDFTTKNYIYSLKSIHKIKIFFEL